MHGRAVIAMLLFATLGLAAQVSQPAAELVAPERLGSLGNYSTLAFLTDNLLLVSNGQNDALSVLFDVNTKAIIGEGRTCAGNGLLVTATAEGNVLASCPMKIVVYDREFRVIHEIPQPIYGSTRPFLLSPERDRIAVFSTGMNILTTDSLEKVAAISPGTFVEALLHDGYVGVGPKQGAVQFTHFQEPKLVTLWEGNQCCVRAFALGGSEILVSRQRSAAIVNASTGESRVLVAEASKADFAVTSVHGKRFVLGFKSYSKAHALKQFNPLKLLEALGTCCNDPTDVVSIRIYDIGSGCLLQELHWKVKNDETIWNRLDGGSALAISPSGELIALFKNRRVVVYRIQALNCSNLQSNRY